MSRNSWNLLNYFLLCSETLFDPWKHCSLWFFKNTWYFFNRVISFSVFEINFKRKTTFVCKQYVKAYDNISPSNIKRKFSLLYIHYKISLQNVDKIQSQYMSTYWNIYARKLDLYFIFQKNCIIKHMKKIINKNLSC